MIPFGWRDIIGALAVLALLAAFWLHGRHVGGLEVRGEWQAQQLADQVAAQAQRESNRLRAQAAAVSYEVQRAAIARRAATPSPESVYALHATICPHVGPLGLPLELGDVPIPLAQLERLRDAGAGYTGR